MNQLSWLIYLADVSGELGWIFGTIFVVSVIVFIISGAFTPPLSSGSGVTEEQWSIWRKFLFGSLAAFFGSAFLGAIVPERETVYAIAASELGEEVVKSETAGKAMTALNNWLDAQISEEPKKEEEQ